MAKGKCILILQEEEERIKLIAEALTKYKEWEEEKQGFGVKIIPEPIQFKPIKEHQLVREGAPTITYSKSTYIEQHELMYKLLKADGRLV
jgi:hypothetical protein